jgi:2-aminoadipate transaminase
MEHTYFFAVDLGATSGRTILGCLGDGFIDRHVPTIRALYKSQCEAMLAALEREFGHTGHGGGDHSLQWNRPAGGMFLWTRLPAGLDAVKLLPKAVAMVCSGEIE